MIVDVSNLYYTVKKRFGDSARLNYERFLSRLQGLTDIQRAIAYGSDMNHAASGFKAVLHRLGFETKYKAPKIFGQEDGKETRKADWDVGMAMDVVRNLDRFDLVILLTADGDLAPCVEYIKEQGKKCWVFGCGISRELKTACDQWYEIVKEDVE